MGPYRLSNTLVGASIGIVVLSVIMSLLGLADPQVYAEETENWTLQAQGQDIGNLFAAAVLAYTALRARAGSMAAYQVWIGALLYFIYAYLIYAMAVHLNYLFLGYVAVLGASAYAVIGALYARGGATMVTDRRAHRRRLPAIVLMLIGGLFGLLWLSELIPALLSDTVPQSLEEAGLIVNPIHVVDLSLVLPGMLVTGYLLMKRHPVGRFWAAPWLAFSVFMGSSIVAAMVLILESGDSDAVPAMMMVTGIVILSGLGLYHRLLDVKHA
jgi:hypothetical protein